MDTRKSPWVVYMIRAASGALYTGITTDLERRFREHRTGEKGARYFRMSAPEQVVFRELHPDRSAASRRETAIKRMSRRQKLELISGNSADLLYTDR